MSVNEAANTQGESEGSPETKSATAEPLGPDSPYIFKHAPPKPEGDLWEILLKPALDADTARCNAWKEEVSTLLIFAGLFSVVVTAFVIESYKSLQPSPNDAVVGLLFHIANNLNSTAPFPPAVNPTSITTPFSQTSSSIRINVLWFISLILSLTTVLVGIISLQWLREHRSYPNVSSREKLAIFHMRSEALDVWFVPHIFSALPVLLQAALALFLAGLIDFVLPLGSTFTIPVFVIIGLPLLFLAATAVLPVCQGFLFLTGFYPYSKPPTPCAFKSPQSRVLLSVFSPFIRVLASVIFWFYERLYSYPSIFRRHTALPFLHGVLQQRSWSNLDQAWLLLRDAYHQCIFGNDPDLRSHQLNWSQNLHFSISDITQYFVKSVAESSTVNDPKAFLGATIHCFHEISTSLWTDNHMPKGIHNVLHEKARYSNYFEQLHGKPFCSISHLIFRSRSYKIRDYKRLVTILRIIGQEQMFYFLHLIHETHPLPQISQYQAELWSRIISESPALPPLSHSPGFSSQIPTLFDNDILVSIYNGHLLKSQRFAAVADMLGAVFKSIAGHRISKDQSLHFLCAHLEMTKVLRQLAAWTNIYLRWTLENMSDTSNQQHVQDIDAHYISIFKFIADHVNDELSGSERDPKKDAPSLLFYLASFFVWNLILSEWPYTPSADALENKDSRYGRGLGSLLEALLQYRTRISSRKNDVVEKRFPNKVSGIKKGKWIQVVQFSEGWWNVLFEDTRDVGLEAAERASNALAPDEDILYSNKVSRRDSRPPSLTRAISNSDDRDQDTKGQSISNSPAIANPITVTNGALDPVAKPPLADSAPSAPDLHANHPPDGNHAADRATVRIPSSSLSPSPTQPPPSSEVGMGPPQLATNVVDDEQARNHADGPHLAIEMGSPTGSEGSEVVEVADSGDGAPEGRARLEDLISTE